MYILTVNIKDVSIEANVSIATVSRVINDKGYISPQTRKKVQQAIKKLNYIPNSAARILQGKRIHTIGIILPSLDNPLYSEFFELIEQKMNEKNYRTILCTSNNQPEKEREYFSLLKANQVEAIITSSHSTDADKLINANYPIISFDRFLSKKIPTVKSDNYSGGRQIAKKIIEFNKKKVLILSGSKEDFYPINDRIKGMLSIFNIAKIDITTSYLDFESSTKVKEFLMRKILSNKDYDAICCTDDLTALLLKKITDSENYYPLITGYDGSTFIRTYFPDLITVIQPLKEMAELCCDLVLQKINYPNKPIEPEYTFPISLTLP